MAKDRCWEKCPVTCGKKFANLRLLYAYMYAQPAKKLLFMGGEFGQWAEWSHDSSLEWHLLQYDSHRQLQQWVADLNQAYIAQNGLCMNWTAIRRGASGSTAAIHSKVC